MEKTIDLNGYTYHIEPTETIKLGEFIDQLKKASAQADADAKEHGWDDRDVRFDFGYTTPISFNSYRGSYDQLALSYDEPSGTVGWTSAKKLIELAEKADGETFTGWKGGDYQMDRDTPLWVACSGDSPSTGILRVAYESVQIIIHTAYIPF